MNNGISGYRAGGINPYRQIEQRGTPPSGPQEISSSPESTPTSASSSEQPELGRGLTDAEAGMITEQFPETERMRLRLYGPGSASTDLDPGSRGRRLDLRG